MSIGPRLLLCGVVTAPPFVDVALVEAAIRHGSNLVRMPLRFRAWRQWLAAACRAVCSMSEAALACNVPDASTHNGNFHRSLNSVNSATRLNLVSGNGGVAPKTGAPSCSARAGSVSL